MSFTALWVKIREADSTPVFAADYILPRLSALMDKLLMPDLSSLFRASASHYDLLHVIKGQYFVSLSVEDFMNLEKAQGYIGVIKQYVMARTAYMALEAAWKAL